MFGVVIICHEANTSNFRRWFYFLNFGWGKSLAYVFIASIMLGSGAAVRWLDVLVSVWLFIMAVLLPIMSCCYREDEVKYVEQKLREIEEAKAEDE